MKLKSTLFAIATFAGFAGSAFAAGPFIIDITGSTAGRSNVDAQIKLLLNGETFAYDNLDGTTAVTNSNRAVRAIYHGSIGADTYIIRTFWSGSAAGVRDVSNSVQLANAYFKTTVLGNASGASITVTAGDLAPASVDTVSEISFSDVFQSSTAFTTVPLAVEDEVAVIPFRFLKNEGATTNITNITAGLVNYLYGAFGEVPAAMITGNTADTKVVYGTGRNNESGTRITTFAESGYGVFNPVNQYVGTVTGGVATLAFAGDGGFSSGGSEATLLGATYPNGDIIGYIGLSDATTAITAGAVALNYNGVPYSSAAVENGQYTLWGYLHQGRLALTGQSLGFYNSLKIGLTNTASAGALLNINGMTVSRVADGSTVSPN